MPPEESRKERRRLRRANAEGDNGESCNEREKEIRRAKGELACAECSRSVIPTKMTKFFELDCHLSLKLKCDKTVSLCILTL